MKKWVLLTVLIVGGVAALGSLSLMAEEQNPTQTPPSTQTPPRPQTPPATPPTQRDQPAKAISGATTTLVGCLYRERDVPGRQPNVAEKAGVGEDFILADASAGTGATTPPAVKMFKVGKIEGDKLKALVGKRVEVVGKLDVDASDVQRTAGGTAPGADRNPVSPDKINLPEIEGVSIKEVPGTCPAKPGAQ